MRELALSLNVKPEPSDFAGTIARARAGDLAAFEELMVRSQRMVFVTALRLLGNREDAKDAAQQVFLRLHKYLHQFRDESGLDQTFAHWLYRMTVNVCRDTQRQHKIGRSSVPLENVNLVSRAAAPDQAVHAEQRREIMLLALEELPEKEKAAVVLRDIQGLSTREVAGILGITEATVRSHISEAR